MRELVHERRCRRQHHVVASGQHIVLGSRGALRETGIHCLPQSTTSFEVGGLCQRTIRWARARLTLCGCSNACV